jgi:hypothetical protein
MPMTFSPEFVLSRASLSMPGREILRAGFVELIIAHQNAVDMSGFGKQRPFCALVDVDRLLKRDIASCRDIPDISSAHE